MGQLCITWKHRSATTRVKHLSCPSCFFAFELFLAASIPEHKDADTNIAPSSVLYRGKGTKVLLKVFPYNCSAGLEACSQVGVDCNNTSGVGLSPHSYTSSHLFFL